MGVQRELTAIEVVEHNHAERSGGGTFLLVAADVNVVLIVPPAVHLPVRD